MYHVGIQMSFISCPTYMVQKIMPKRALLLCLLHSGSQNYLCDVSTSSIIECSRYSEEPDPPGSIEFLEMAQELMTLHNLIFPRSIQEAIDVYVTMTTVLESHVF